MDKLKIPIYQVDAFASKIFGGNPAAVCILDSWLDDETLQAIAAENNLSETAFLVKANSDHEYEIRWLTPVTEVALCGHATLASSYVLFECRGHSSKEIVFHTRKSGQLKVSKINDGLFELDFPARETQQRTAPSGLCDAIGIDPEAVFLANEDFMLVLNNELDVHRISPNFNALSQVECRGVIVTAPGENSDFVSRFFAPRVGINEDPVTGSAHCALIPYWSDRLRRDRLLARQISARGGELFCENSSGRVKIAGRAVLFFEGEITI